MTAIFSPDRRYRYTLSRRWPMDLLLNLKAGGVLSPHPQAVVAFIGLNPSTADETIDDPTIRRCMAFARGWGFGGLVMLNLFAFRATDPAAMKREDDPVGPENDAYLAQALSVASLWVCCWGNHGDFRGRGRQVLDLMVGLCARAPNGGPPIRHFGLTKTGQPRHPLYMPKMAVLEEMLIF
jgi:hypothetical protein